MRPQKLPPVCPLHKVSTKSIVKIGIHVWTTSFDLILKNTMRRVELKRTLCKAVESMMNNRYIQGLSQNSSVISEKINIFTLSK